MTTNSNMNSLAMLLDRSNLVTGFDVDNPLTNSEKWIIALFFGILFLLISLPFAFYLSNSVAVSLGVPRLYYFEGGPTIIGLIIQAIIFAVIVRLFLW
jgi:hypothetical protein